MLTAGEAFPDLQPKGALFASWTLEEEDVRCRARAV